MDVPGTYQERLIVQKDVPGIMEVYALGVPVNRLCLRNVGLNKKTGAIETQPTISIKKPLN
ncbi:hypothetical protein D3C85_1263880 [compost metagenome]